MTQRENGKNRTSSAGFHDRLQETKIRRLKALIENAGYNLIKRISDNVYMAIDASGRKYIVKDCIEIGFDGRPTYDDPEKCVRVLTRIQHDNIQRLHKYFMGEKGSRVVLITDYVPGEPLARYIFMRPLSLPETFSILDQIIRAVTYLHEQGIVHRDLTPANVIYDGRKATIIDFGAATFIGAYDDGNILMTIALNYSRMEHCYDWLRPPEFDHCDFDTDPRLDIFYIGVLALEIITGNLYYYNEKSILHSTDILEKVIRDVVIPNELKEFIRKATAVDPQKRYRNMETLSRDFKRVSKQSGYI